MQSIPPGMAACARQITPAGLLYLGAQQVAYVKVGMFDGERAFIIYGADGTPLAVVDAFEEAAEMLIEHGLNLVTVH
jgi:hypothetical protein